MSEGTGTGTQACTAKVAGSPGLSLTPALPISGKIGPVGDQGLGDSPVLGPVGQGDGEGLPKDVLDVVTVVGPHPAGVERHPRGMGEQVAVGLGTPKEGRRDRSGWQGAHQGPPSLEMGPGGRPWGRGGAGNSPGLMKNLGP